MEASRPPNPPGTVQCDHCGEAAHGQLRNRELCEHCGAILPEPDPTTVLMCGITGLEQVRAMKLWLQEQLAREPRRRLG